MIAHIHRQVYLPTTVRFRSNEIHFVHLYDHHLLPGKLELTNKSPSSIVVLIYLFLDG